MGTTPKILAFAGSLRKDSYNKKVAKIVAAGAERAGAEVNYIELNDYPMPIYNADEHAASGFPENALIFQRLLSEHDGLIVSSPEYNGSLPGGLKNVIDWASRTSDEFKMGAAFTGKLAAITTASPGAFGGLRCLGHLRSVLSILQVHVLPTEIAVGNAHKMFAEESDEMQDERMKDLLNGLGGTLADMLRKTHG